MLIKLAIWYLRRKKVSAIFNMKITGGKVQQKTNRGATYDTEFYDAQYLLSNGKAFVVPQGKFTVRQNV